MAVMVMMGVNVFFVSNCSDSGSSLNSIHYRHFQIHECHVERLLPH